MKKIIIIGGGIAGLISANRLAQVGYDLLVIEKNTYPRHKVCGEYLSREVENFLKEEQLLPTYKSLPVINRLKLSSSSGAYTYIPLKMGGIGISRFFWENFLYEKAIKAGVNFIFDSVNDVNFSTDFKVKTRSGKHLTADYVIGAHGKRSKLDRNLERSFFYKRSPYIGVKYHFMNSEYANDLIGLHNFQGGYCGISRVEDDIINFCYLCNRDTVRKYGGIESFEKNILEENPFLSSFITNSTKVFKKPYVINEISFETKSPVENGIPMIGDSAGMITPLCGNGMAMAVHSAKILTDLLISKTHLPVNELNEDYSLKWNATFKNRLYWGRIIQNNFFGKNWASSLAVNLGKAAPMAAKFLVSKTHGKKI